jgi:hypothetical protein
MKLNPYLLIPILTLCLHAATFQLHGDEAPDLPSESPGNTTLLNRNPFLPADHRSPQAPTRPVSTAVNAAERDLELRAFYEFGGTYYLSLFNRQNQQSTWLSPGESKNGIQLRSFTSGNRTASVQFAGSTAQLRLKEPSETPMPVTRDPIPLPTQPQLPGEIVPTPANGAASENRPSVPRRRVILPQAPAES